MPGAAKGTTATVKPRSLWNGARRTAGRPPLGVSSSQPPCELERQAHCTGTSPQRQTLLLPDTCTEHTVLDMWLVHGSSHTATQLSLACSPLSQLSAHATTAHLSFFSCAASTSLNEPGPPLVRSRLCRSNSPSRDGARTISPLEERCLAGTYTGDSKVSEGCGP